MSLALIQHLNLTKDTAAAVTWSLLDDLEETITSINILPHRHVCLICFRAVNARCLWKCAEEETRPYMQVNIWVKAIPSHCTTKTPPMTLFSVDQAGQHRLHYTKDYS